MTNHFFGDMDRKVILAVVHEEFETYKGGKNGTATGYSGENVS
jgi:hypothetical protein